MSREGAERGELALELPPDPALLASLRRELVAFLVAAGAERRRLVGIVVATHEIVANAILHADTATINVRAHVRGPRVTIQIADAGAWHPRSTPRAEGGMGLPLVHQLVDHTNVEHREDGTRVTLTSRIS